MADGNRAAEPASARLKVGILSMQKLPNYGSFMQAFALKRTLEKLGAEVSFIDIEPGEPLPGLEWGKSPWQRFKVRRAAAALVNGSFYNRAMNRVFSARLSRQFSGRFFDMLGIGPKLPDTFDLVVIGSDEVFNACQRVPWAFSTQLFGAGLPARRVVSYAASFGHTTAHDIDKYGIRKKIASALGNVAAISVRDRNSFEIIRDLTGTEPELHLDPVLTYEWPGIKTARSAARRETIVYTYPCRVTPAEERVIRQHAKSNGQRLVSVGSFYHWCDENPLPATPLDVLARFRDADSIVTDTFHGSIFSIINRKRFCAMVRDSNRQKLEFMLKQLGLEQQIARSSDDVGRILSTTPDYSTADKIIEAQRLKSKAYLERCFSGLRS